MPKPGTPQRDSLVHRSSPVEDPDAEIHRLRHGLELIVRESEQFPDEDGIGAGTMARNILERAS